MARSLLNALRHRGPDDEGIEHPSPSVTLIHTRLAILDLSRSGHQPMTDHPKGDGQPNWVITNGEIFNYRELQAELTRAEWPCRTRSDTEVVLHSYRVWGTDCVERFRGMFAFCIVDQDLNRAFLYRDRLGIKPLYLYRPPSGGLIFASEIRALLSLGPDSVSPRINPRAMESFFAQGAVQGYETLVGGVTMLEPGTCMTVDLATGKQLDRRKYWQLPTARFEETNREAAVERIGELARKAVSLRLISDVPTGLFLSGGIDSAAMLALASEGNGKEAIRTISLGFDIADYDESIDAAATAASLGSDHTCLKITGEDVLTALPDVLKAMDQPTVDGMNTYVVSQAARRAGLTVALSGLGGDELFGGYASFTDVPRAVSLRRRIGWTGLGRLARHLKPSRSGVKFSEAARRAPDLLTMYLLRRELFLPAERRALQPQVPDGSDDITGVEQSLIDDLQNRSAGLDDINRISFFEIELYMRHMLLRDADVFSMVAPIEYRVPFLDHKLVEMVFSLPGKWKRPDPRLKPLLLDAVGPRLPSAAWQKPKRGFTFPWQSWFAPDGALAETTRDAANDVEIWKRLGVSPAGVSNIWQRFNAGDRRVSPLELLAFVTLHDYAVRHGLQAA